MTRQSWIMWAVALYVLAGTFSGVPGVGSVAAWAQTNETVTVQARAKDNPQQNPADIEGHFTQSPTGDKDEIHVTNDGVEGDSAGVYNDPVNDGALLTIVQDSGPVKVDVEGREGIGAIYWVTVIPGGGGGGGGGGPPPVLWADERYHPARRAGSQGHHQRTWSAPHKLIQVL